MSLWDFMKIGFVDKIYDIYMFSILLGKVKYVSSK
jgi:hypothetical protein